MSRKISAPPVRGEKCSLTSPFIEQAFALTTGGQGVLAVFEHFERTLLARPSPRSYFMKCFSNRTCERFPPFSVSKTDFAFVAVAPLMEAIEGIPVVTFPCPLACL